MIKYTHFFGKSIPVDLDRVTRSVRTAKLALFFFLFACISALFHPSEQLASASIARQCAFWVVGFLVYFFGYRIILVSAVRFATWRGWSTLYASGPVEVTNLIAAALMFAFAKLIGIPTDDTSDLIKFFAFNIVLYELGTFCYIAYADRTMYPDIYAPLPQPHLDREVFLPGTTFLTHQVDFIIAAANGVEVSSNGRTVFIPRPFGQVIADLPIDLGFQIHRSLWVARKLALKLQSDGFRQFVQVPDGRRFPMARTRKRAYRDWLDAIKIRS